MGFFAEAGPLQVFVSNHLIPEEFEFSTAHEPCYQTADGDQKIVPGSEVRLRIVGTRVDASDIVSAALGAGLGHWAVGLGAGQGSGGGQSGGWRATAVQAGIPVRPRWRRPLLLAPNPEQFAVGSIKEDYLGVISAPI